MMVQWWWVRVTSAFGRTAVLPVPVVDGRCYEIPRLGPCLVSGDVYTGTVVADAIEWSLGPITEPSEWKRGKTPDETGTR